MRGKGHDEANIQYFDEDDSWVVLCDCGADFQVYGERGEGVHEAFDSWLEHMNAARSS